jgi:GMP synthase (glutamine-hydrolysing)
LTKTLIINCYRDSQEINELREAIGKFSPFTIVPYEKIGADYQISQDIGAIVISGSKARIVNSEDRAKYDNVSKLIKKCNVPIFAVCFGHQLLCSAFGAKTSTLPQPIIDKFENVNVIQTGDIFSRLKAAHTIPLAEWHNDYVLKESLDDAGFHLLADSKTCQVEAVKHKTKFFYGVQFHPERININGEIHPEGHKVIENFYVNIVKRFGL